MRSTRQECTTRSRDKKGINKIEHEIANKAGYHDAMLGLEGLYKSGKVHFCNA